VSTLDQKPPVAEEPSSSSASPVAVKSLKPITFWAVLGILFVLLQAYVYTDWLTGPTFSIAHPTEPVPTITKFWCWALQIGTGITFTSVLVYVIRQCRRERRLTFDAMLAIAWAAVAWQDLIVNLIRPTFFYNSYLISFTSWGPSIPGWISPNGSGLPEPIFLAGFGYMDSVFFCMIICAVMRLAKRRMPSLNAIGLIAVAIAMGAVLDLALEVACVRTKLWAYPGTIQSLSLWGGEHHQFPIYESLLWGSVWAAAACLRYFRDDKGRSVVERGADSLAASNKWRTALRAFAVIGFVNAMYVVYNVMMSFIALQIDQTPAGYPEYLRNGLCGPGTAWACPGPDVPIPMNGNVVQPNPAST
jgi:hypothetical protein